MMMQLRRPLVALFAISICASALVAQAQPTGYLDGNTDNAPGYLTPDAAERQDAPPSGYLNAPDAGYVAPAPAEGGYFGRPKSTTDTFVPAPENARENVNGGTLMLIAYAGFWLLTIGYVTSIASRARHANRELVELRRHIQELDDRIEELDARGA